jgi:hypothetical protein
MTPYPRDTQRDARKSLKKGKKCATFKGRKIKGIPEKEAV